MSLKILPFILIGAKIQKKQEDLIYCVIWELSGIMPYYIGMMIIAGIVGEVIKNFCKKHF